MGPYTVGFERNLAEVVSRVISTRALFIALPTVTPQESVDDIQDQNCMGAEYQAFRETSGMLQIERSIGNSLDTHMQKA